MYSRTRAGMAHEMRSMLADGVSRTTVARYFGMHTRDVMGMVYAHSAKWPELPPFDGDCGAWRLFLRDRLARSLRGEVSFVFPLPD